ncbi:MAG: preprotein translocase subunit SecG [Pusillimonas sp.]|nr:preprotein translocase subunit SecG [Pusillimonas sp.]
MEWLSSFLLAIQVISSLSIIVLVLLQQGKGADMGAAFGSGSAGSVFGATGAANFLSRITKWAAVIFFASTIGLAWVSHRTGDSILDSGIMQGYEEEAPVEGSAVPRAPGAGSEVPATGSEVPGTGSEVPGTGSQVPAASGSATESSSSEQVPVAPAPNAVTE